MPAWRPGSTPSRNCLRMRGGREERRWVGGRVLWVRSRGRGKVAFEIECYPSHFAATIPGGFHVPSPGGKIEGGESFGEYNRMIRYARPLGAGSQFDSLLLPGESFWIYSVSESSSFFFMLGSIGELIRKRLIGFLISSCDVPSYIVTDQNAFTGGRLPFVKVSV